jgi:hypothetical protein
VPVTSVLIQVSCNSVLNFSTCLSVTHITE